MQVYIHIVPPYIPEAECAHHREVSGKCAREAARLQPVIDRLSAQGKTEKWAHSSMSQDEVTWRDWRQANARQLVEQQAAEEALQRPSRLAYADIRCVYSYEQREALKNRGYIFERLSHHAITLQATPAWRRQMEIWSASSLRAVAEEIEWLKSLGTRVCCRQGIDLLMAAFAGDPRLAGLE